MTQQEQEFKEYFLSLIEDYRIYIRNPMSCIHFLNKNNKCIIEYDIKLDSFFYSYYNLKLKCKQFTFIDFQKQSDVILRELIFNSCETLS